MPAFYGGVEGGGTNTVVVIVNEKGEVVGEARGGGSNGYLIGVPAAAAVLVELFRAAAASAAASGHAPAGLAVSLPLASIGACMSGFAEPGPQAALVSALRALAPSLAAGYWVDNDAPGAIITAAGGAGGAVLIAGTGSMALYVPPAGAPARGGTVCVGGHGHMMGDEGSAFSLAAAGVRAALAAGDAYAAAGGAPPAGAAVEAAMLRYFGVAAPEGMLDVMYGAAFQKPRVAGFALELAGVALAGDALARALFARAGAELGAAARALAPHALRDGAPPGEREVRDFVIVAVGSVWKSWPLLADAFVAATTEPFSVLPARVAGVGVGVGAGAGAGATAGGEPAATASGRRLPHVDVSALPPAARGRLASFSLVRLRVTSAIGAAWRGSAVAGGAPGGGFPLDAAANAEPFFSWPPPIPAPAPSPSALGAPPPPDAVTILGASSRALVYLLSTLRAADTPRAAFVAAADRAAALLADEALARAPGTAPADVKTPCGVARGLAGPPPEAVVAVSVVRSGDVLADAVRRAAPGSRGGRLLIQRDEHAAGKPAALSWAKLPPGIASARAVLVCDPMLATGGSAVAALDALARAGVAPDAMLLVCLVGAPEGLARVRAAHPRVRVLLGALDDGLDERCFIVPGLGDFGDRYAGTED